MLQKKTGLPAENELVLCTVTNIQYNSVFVRLLEYNHTGMIHISEVSPGRIRNIRDYVKEGKTIVCKVLRVNPERQQIDLSLRRVSEAQRREKSNSMKQEQIALRIIEFVAKRQKQDPNALAAAIQQAIIKKYDRIYPFFEHVALGITTLEKEGVKGGFADDLLIVLRQRIKQSVLRIGGVLNLLSYESDGVEIIKQCLQSIAELGKKQAVITYLGAGKYKVIVTSTDYKDAESILKSMTDRASAFMKEHRSQGSFARQES